ncbi:DNA adenine methylase [Oceanospirillum beijerinckii]|uniref:DNA adenine methylase n=1 Tax=Oceanospirillum beijerinckii TaxID=64976 RepID=UPI000405CC1B|nr:DNA adenine methylase [Oceanospirillum beijerinckii]
MPSTNTPLRYPGGKSQLTPLIIELMQANNLLAGEYAEPFSGGAGIAINLLLKGHVNHIYLNDFDEAIYAFWYSVINFSEALCELIEKTDITMDEWHRQKSILFSDTPDLLEKGFAALFLNRTNRSGILKAGVIGGLKQAGSYKLDCRFTKPTLIKKIQRITEHRDSITLTQLDALEFIKCILPTSSKNTLINLDPPYFKRGQELYTNAYSRNDHQELAKAVQAIDRSWMVTYDYTPEIRELYQQYPMYSNKLNYSAQTKRIGTELLILDPKLIAPGSLKDQRISCQQMFEQVLLAS